MKSEWSDAAEAPKLYSPTTITKVILMVFIFAFGITPFEQIPSRISLVQFSEKIGLSYSFGRNEAALYLGPGERLLFRLWSVFWAPPSSSAARRGSCWDDSCPRSQWRSCSSSKWLWLPEQGKGLLLQVWCTVSTDCVPDWSSTERGPWWLLLRRLTPPVSRRPRSQPRHWPPAVWLVSLREMKPIQSKFSNQARLTSFGKVKRVSHCIISIKTQRDENISRRISDQNLEIRRATNKSKANCKSLPNVLKESDSRICRHINCSKILVVFFHILVQKWAEWLLNKLLGQQSVGLMDTHNAC